MSIRKASRYVLWMGSIAGLVLSSCDRTSDPIAQEPPKAAEGTVNTPTLDSTTGDTPLHDFHDTTLRVYLSTLTPGAKIHYTTDRSTPTSASPLYTDSGIRIDSSVVLKAVAIREGWVASQLLVDSIAFRCMPPVLDGMPPHWWAWETWDQPIDVKLVGLSQGSRIHYTTDGSEPTNSSPLYANGIHLDSSCQIKAIATRQGWKDSDTLWRSFKLQAQPAAFVVDSSLRPPFGISMSCPTPGVAIRYTTDSTVPDRRSTRYGGPLTFRAYDVETNYTAVAFDTLHPGIAPSRPVRLMVDQRLPWNPKPVYGSVTDSRDGRAYRTVKIGKKTWMAENLAFETDRSWCYAGDQANCGVYGRLYQWTTAMGLDTSFVDSFWTDVVPRRGICPVGFHLPSDAEWNELIGTAETFPDVGKALAGVALQVKSNRWWYPSPVQDLFGLRLLFSGWRVRNSEFDYLGSFGIYWTASQSQGDNDRAIHRAMQDGTIIGSESSYKTNAASVRCVEDAR